MDCLLFLFDFYWHFWPVNFEGHQLVIVAGIFQFGSMYLRLVLQRVVQGTAFDYNLITFSLGLHCYEKLLYLQMNSAKVLLKPILCKLSPDFGHCSASGFTPTRYQENSSRVLESISHHVHTY